MSNVLDYVEWRSDLSFKKNRFNMIDALVFTQLIYLELTEYVPDYCGDKVRRLEEVLDDFFEGNRVHMI